MTARVDPGIFNVALQYGSANIRKTQHSIITTNKTYIKYLRVINLLNILYLKLNISGVEAQEAAEQSLTIQLTI